MLLDPHTDYLCIGRVYKITDAFGSADLYECIHDVEPNVHGLDVGIHEFALVFNLRIKRYVGIAFNIEYGCWCMCSPTKWGRPVNVELTAFPSVLDRYHEHRHCFWFNA